MNGIITERTSEIIATEINSIKDQTRQMVLYNSIEIGKRLVEAKAIVPHGEWGKWLEQSVDYSQSTANNLMKIYEEYGDGTASLFGGDAKSESIASLPYTKALALLSIPNYEREEFVEENKVHDLSTRQLQQVIKEKKELEKKLEIYEDKAEEHRQLSEQIDAFKKNIKILENKLEAAEENNNEEVIDELNKDVERLNNDLTGSTEKIKKLEEELKEKPKEVIPDEVKKELDELREKANDTRDESEIKFKVEFDTLVRSFNTTIEAVEAIGNADNRSKYKNAIKKLIDSMNDIIKVESQNDVVPGQMGIDDYKVE